MILGQVCYRVAIETEIEIQDVNFKEATRFLAMKMSKQEVVNHELRKFIPKRKHINGTRPTMASALAKGPGNIKDEEEQWEWPNVVLTKCDRKRINAEVLKLFVQFFEGYQSDTEKQNKKDFKTMSY